MSFSTKDFNLTDKEQTFIQKFLANNGCAAETPGELLEDNYSCQCLEDFQDIEFIDFSGHQVAGLLSSLIEKGIIYKDERDGAICKSKSRLKQFQFEPDLYWANETYLASLDPDLKFSNCNKD